MFPHDLPPTCVDLPPGSRDSAVLFTGPRPRHLRLGYLLQRRFPGLLRAWYVTRPSPGDRVRSKLERARQLALSNPTVAAARGKLARRQWDDWRDLGDLARRGLRAIEWGRVTRAVASYSRPSGYDRVEDAMFEREIEALRPKAALHPMVVASPNDEATVAEVEAIEPYFLIALGGPLLRGRLLKAARGIALNQHAGWSPALRGASTVETALYHRKIGWVGNTVHVMNTFADAGAIVRRSTATLHPDDALGHCFMASVALGTKMMLECIETAVAEGRLTVFLQPQGGETVNIIDYVPAKRAAVARDLGQGWLGDALRIVRDF